MRAVKHWPCLDAIVLHRLHDPITIYPFGKKHADQPLPAFDARRALLEIYGRALKTVSIERGDCSFASKDIRQALDLRQADCSADIRHPVIEAPLHMPISLRGRLSLS